MYSEYFNLRRDPFRLTPEPELSFAHPSYAKAWAYLQYGLRQGEGFVVVTGRPGSGKTTLMRALLEEHRNDRLISAALVHTRFDASDLGAMVAHAFGLSVEGADRIVALDRLRRFLEQQLQQGNRALLIIDEAQGLSAEALNELYVLSSLDFDGRPLMQVFLLGQEQLRGVIHAAGTEQLRQRLIAACHLEPLDAPQTEAYVRHRLTDSGWRDDPRFDPRLFSLIQHFSEGLPRRINTLCSRLLLYAAVHEQHVLEPRDLIRVVDELREERLYAPGASADPEPSPLLDVAPDLPEQTAAAPRDAEPQRPEPAPEPPLMRAERRPEPFAAAAPPAPIYAEPEPEPSLPAGAAEPVRAEAPSGRRSKPARVARSAGLALAGAMGGIALLLAYERLDPGVLGLAGTQERPARSTGATTGDMIGSAPGAGQAAERTQAPSPGTAESVAAAESPSLPAGKALPAPRNPAQGPDAQTAAEPEPAVSQPEAPSPGASPDPTEAPAMTAMGAASDAASPASGPRATAAEAPTGGLAEPLADTSIQPAPDTQQPGGEAATAQAGTGPQAPPATAATEPDPGPELAPDAAPAPPEPVSEPAAEPQPQPRLADSDPAASTAARTGDPVAGASAEPEGQTSSTQVQQLLALAESALEDYRLTTPPTDSALYYYRAVLRLDPENTRAQLGFDKIAYRYALLARNAINEGRQDLARLYVRRGLSVDPAQPALRAMER